MPRNYYFGGGGTTVITPLALAVLILAALLVLILPRRYVIVPLLVAGLLLPYGLNVAVFGLNFPFLRLLLLAGWLRLALRRDFKRIRWSSLDKVVLAWALCNAVCYSILWGESGAIINRLGFLYTTLGTYLLLRQLVCSKADVLLSIRVLASVLIVLAPLMLYERLTGDNAFYVVGSSYQSSVRDGHIRAQGPFGHAIVAGTLGATLVPLFVGLWWYNNKHRILAVAAVLACSIVALTSSSSTPLMSLSAGILALLLWRGRRQLRILRWAFVAAVLALHLVMKAPVWFLIARMSSLTGGSGWHRAMLIDNFVRRFGDWWVIGTRENAYWGYEMRDVVNAYVAAGQSGGLLTLILYLGIFVYAYKTIGLSWRATEQRPSNARLIWGVGSTLFATTVAFFGIIYFDQSALAWYALLAMTAATKAFAIRASSPDRHRVTTETAIPASAFTATAVVLGAPSYRTKYFDVFGSRF